MSEATAALTHDAASGVGLAITSSNGYVDVESVRFTGLQMGLDGAADLITLSNANVKITGTLDTTGYIKVASTKFTVDATGNTYADGTLGVKGVSTLEDDLLLSEDAAVIKHSVAAGSTTGFAGLSILSENYHVDVESVRFTDAKIGTTSDADLITLADDAVAVAGRLTVSGDVKLSEAAAVIDSHCRQCDKAASLTIKSSKLPCGRGVSALHRCQDRDDDRRGPHQAGRLISR